MLEEERSYNRLAGLYFISQQFGISLAHLHVRAFTNSCAFFG